MLGGYQCWEILGIFKRFWTILGLWNLLISFQNCNLISYKWRGHPKGKCAHSISNVSLICQGSHRYLNLKTFCSCLFSVKFFALALESPSNNWPPCSRVSLGLVPPLADELRWLIVHWQDIYSWHLRRKDFNSDNIQDTCALCGKLGGDQPWSHSLWSVFFGVESFFFGRCAVSWFFPSSLENLVDGSIL